MACQSSSSEMFIIADEQSVYHQAAVCNFIAHTHCTVDAQTQLHMKYVTRIVYCCTCTHTATVVTVLTDGGPYVSADDIPEQAEIHPLHSSGGD